MRLTLNVLPSVSCHNPLDVASIGLEISRQLSLERASGMTASDLKHIFLRQQRMPVFFTRHNYKSTLRNAIIGVVGLSSKKQMIRIAARRIIAFVKNLHSWWDRSVFQSPRKAMGQNWSTSMGPNPTVTIVGAIVSDPRPTFTGFAFSNLLPKSFFSRSPSGDSSSASHIRASRLTFSCSCFTSNRTKKNRRFGNFIHLEMLNNRLRMST